MGFFRRRERAPEQQSDGSLETTERPAWMTQGMTAALYEGTDSLDVVGESHYQENLWVIVGGRTEEHVRHSIHALLVPEDDNQYDQNAISIWIDGLIVGYLSRDDAAAYRAGLLALQSKEQQPIALHGVIAGGGQRDDGIGMLGVFLSHDPADFGIAPPQPHGPGVRTALHEELGQGHLAWYSELPDDDARAIAKLRQLLDGNQDPIDRHFIYSELEKRLYHCRTIFTSALDDFDAVCNSHDQEMENIRAALISALGEVPMLETYKQMVIRQQKAQNWTQALHWAERGIAMYSDDAGRPEWVDDLRKRSAYCTAKLNSPAATRGRSPRSSQSRDSSGTNATITTGVEFETLTCTACGRGFDRAVTRGRKPHHCPDCRE